MPIKDIQARHNPVGEIRIGDKVTFRDRDGNTRSRPTTIDTFRFTSTNRIILQCVAQLYGGEIIPWDGKGGGLQLVTERDELPVVIRPDRNFVFTQNYELYGKSQGAVRGRLLRRCDSEIESSGEPRPCLCAIEGKKVCKPKTRIRVHLPQVPGLGCWSISSGSYNFAAETLATMNYLFDIAQITEDVIGMLKIEKRVAVVDGNPKDVSIPVLHILRTTAELNQGVSEQALTMRSEEPQPLPVATAEPNETGELVQSVEAILREMHWPALDGKGSHVYWPILSRVVGREIASLGDIQREDWSSIETWARNVQQGVWRVPAALCAEAS